MSENEWMRWELSEAWVQLFINETRRSQESLPSEPKIQWIVLVARSHSSQEPDDATLLFATANVWVLAFQHTVVASSRRSTHAWPG
jgi:hypothetical protein